MVERRDAHMVLVGKPEGKRPLGRHTCRWEDNIKMDLLYMAQSIKVRLNRGETRNMKIERGVRQGCCL
jgi:hypothetical protein